tara:strand:+ start:56 stop:244 length:189 start_codon:yes stop_codon:yes gene_type:complete
VVGIPKIGTLKLLVHIIHIVILLYVLEIRQRTLRRLLEGALVVDVDVSVVVVYDNDTAIGWV